MISHSIRTVTLAPAPTPRHAARPQGSRALGGALPGTMLPSCFAGVALVAAFALILAIVGGV